MGGQVNPQMSVGGAMMPMSQIQPNMLSPQELYAYNQARAYQQMPKQGAGQTPQQALSDETYKKYLGIMQQYFPNQNFYLR